MVVTSEHAILRDHFTAAARRLERKVFLEHGAAEFSYRAVDEWTDRVASGLVRLGLRRGDRIALVLSNRPELVFLAWGATKIGAVPVLIAPELGSAQMAADLERAGAAALVSEARFETLVSAAGSRLSSLRHTLFVDGAGGARFRSLLDGPVLDFWPDLDPVDPALVLFTRRGRAASNAVVLSHRNLLANCRQLQQPLRIDGSDRFLVPLPLATPEGIVFGIMVPWMAGATAILGDGTGAAAARLVDERGVTVLAATPALCRELAAAPDAVSEDAALRLAACLSGPVDAPVHDELERRYDALVVEGYGLVEATCAALANPYTGLRKPGSLGLPLPDVECRLVDRDDRDLGPGPAGEIVLRGPNVMTGYLDDPQSSHRALRGGWLHTGDTGYVDPDGYYYLFNTRG